MLSCQTTTHHSCDPLHMNGDRCDGEWKLASWEYSRINVGTREILVKWAFRMECICLKTIQSVLKEINGWMIPFEEICLCIVKEKQSAEYYE